MSTVKQGDQVRLVTCGLIATIVGVHQGNPVEYEVAGMDVTGKKFRCREVAERLHKIEPETPPAGGKAGKGDGGKGDAGNSGKKSGA